MERHRETDARTGKGNRDSEPLEKKPYTSPELQEWGSIVDLTQGATFLFNDMPLRGGSRPT